MKRCDASKERSWAHGDDELGIMPG